MNIRKTGSGLFAFFLLFALLFWGSEARFGASEGIVLCYKTIIPTLFPFFFLSNIIISALLGKENKLLRWIGKIFSIPNGYESILIPAFLGGYPTGAAAICNLYHDGALSKNEAERMLSFCNNAGPSFILGMIAPTLSKPTTAWIIWLSQILGAYSAAVLISSKSSDFTGTISCKPQPISESMSTAIYSTAIVCGWVILFRIVLTLLQPVLIHIPSQDLRVLFSGLLELSNGCCLLPKVMKPESRVIIANFMLSIGGVCVTMQTLSLLDGLSPQKYFYGKLIQTVVSIFISYSAMKYPYLLFILISGIIIFNIKKNVAFQTFTVYNERNYHRRKEICFSERK